MRLRGPTTPVPAKNSPAPASFPESWRASPESAATTASRRHDVPSATSDVPSATSNPNDGDGYACGDAGEHGKSLSQLGRARILWYLRMIEPRETKLMVLPALSCRAAKPKRVTGLE